MTFGSLQPISSKWWCSGAILKTRCPVSLNDATWMIDRQRLEHEHAADDDEQQLLLDEDRDGAERAAERQRPDVAHEDFGGVRVVPEEAEATRRPATPQKIVSSAAGGKRTSSRYSAKHAVTGHVGQRRVGRGRDREDADRQAVEAVGQVDGVRLGDEHEHRERHVAPAEIRNEALEEREDQPRVVEARRARARAATTPTAERRRAIWQPIL